MRRIEHTKGWSHAAVVAFAMLVTIVPCVAGPDAEDGEERPDKVVKMDAENWEFIPNMITVHQGDRVVLKVRSFHAPHRFDLKAYGLKVPLPQGETTTIEFVADKAGRFPFRCGRPCGDGCPRMRGKLIVLAAPPADD